MRKKKGRDTRTKMDKIESKNNNDDNGTKTESIKRSKLNENNPYAWRI